MRILLFGKNGQLGRELNRTLIPLGEAIAVGHSEVDLENLDLVRNFIRQSKPDHIINSAAYTEVDHAETNRESAMRVNALAPEVMAEEANRLGAIFIHYSTDYVFDGKKGTPYAEDDAANPLNVYGLSKLRGERAIQAVGGNYVILRTSWVYSLRQKEGFINKVLKWARTQDMLRIVDDQIGSPTSARMLAEITSQMLALGDRFLSERNGIYHVAGDGYASRLEWVRKILALDPHQDEHICSEILPAITSDFPTPALRPLFSALNCDRFAATFGLRLPNWEQALRLAMTGA